MLKRFLHLMGKGTIIIFILASALIPAQGPPAQGVSSASAPVTVSLTSYLNSKGIGNTAGQANFDGSKYGYPADQLPSGKVILNNIPYLFPTSSSSNDNVVAVGQNITLPPGNYLQVSLLAASSYGPVSGTATINYTDGTTSSVSLTVPDWYSSSGGVITSTYRYSPTGTDHHMTSIFAVELPINSTRVASSVTLPKISLPANHQACMHIFAMTLLSATQGYALRILDASSAMKEMTGTSSTQVVEATIENTGTLWFTPRHQAIVRVQASKVQTVVPAVVSELAPGEQARVEIGIKNTPSLTLGTQETGTVTAGVDGGNTVSLNFPLIAGVPAYSVTDASLTQHQSPDWYDNAKFGIFIHWGVYSVPAWAPTTSSGASTEYAEWYWNHMDNSGDPTHQHHLQTYGQNTNYDDFIPQFTAAKFDPKAWVQLFQQAGAKYFVLVSKHHDGFALFKTQYSHRDAFDLGPHKDLVQELFDAAAKNTPSLKRGLYYSMPEWYNPSYPGDPSDSSFPGGSPHNPYTGQQIPYTGYIPVSNYVQDFQKPQMLELVKNYHPDLLWCDIGGPNDSNAVFADYFNRAQATGQQVAVNNRCGNAAHDFTTPEYSTYSSLTTDKWESNRGIDPFSFGYNSSTAPSAYATADQLIRYLVDIVSKNGNLLLDIGPKADGTIPAIMQQRLQEIGAWLKVNGESIYNTTYWWRTPQDGDLRFTISPNKAFYITSLVQPSNQIVVNQPVPIQQGNQITMLGYKGGPLHWSQQGGKLIIDVPVAAQQAGQHAWVFKIDWNSGPNR